MLMLYANRFIHGLKSKLHNERWKWIRTGEMGVFSLRDASSKSKGYRDSGKIIVEIV